VGFVVILSVSSLPFFVELNKLAEYFLHATGRSNQVRYSEMVRSRGLAKPTARHSHNSGLFNHVHAIFKVGLNTFSLALVNEFLGEV
jgi:hypothetical protein